MNVISPNPETCHQGCHKCKDGRANEKIFFYHFGVIDRRFCDCEKGKRAFQNWCRKPEVQKAFRQKQETKIKRALEMSAIPARWEGQSLKDIVDEKVKQKLTDYLSDFPKMRACGNGVYFSSRKESSEKTQLLTIQCYEIIARYAQPCIFLSEDQIFSRIQSSFNRSEGSYDFIAQLQKVPCLFIDGFATKINNWRCEQLQSIIGVRYNNALPTFFSSFYSLQEYHSAIKKILPHEQYLASIVTQICKNFEIIL